MINKNTNTVKSPTLIVVDDYLNDPKSVTRELVDEDFASNGKAPGRQSFNAGYQEDWVAADFERIIGNKILYPLELFGILRLITKNDPILESNIHADPFDWAAIIYLTLPKFCQGGTSFYRFKATEWESAPSNKELRDNGYNDVDELIRSHSKDSKMWDINYSIPMKHNRLILYKANQFHAATSLGKNGQDARSGFGSNIENARLTMNFFFNSAN